MKILVALSKVAGSLAAGQQFAKTTLTVTDDTGAPAQTADLTGAETPTPWAATFTVSDGHVGSVSAQDLDTTGAPIGAAVVEPYDSTGTGGGTVGDTFPQTAAIAISPVT
jgi:hypothetical protein